MFFVALALPGCVHEPKFDKDQQLQSLLADYQARTIQIKEQEQQSVLATIRRLDVVRSSDGSQYTVSVDLARAPVALVVDRILATSRVSYDMSDIRLNGMVTARFSGVPLLVALNRLVNPHGVSVGRTDQILVFRRGTPISAATTDAAAPAGSGASATAGGPPATADTGKVYEEVALQSLKVSDAVSLLQGLYPPGVEGPKVTVGALNELNAVYIGGVRSEVQKAVAVLNQADQDVPHVLIEALVVEFDTAAVDQLGAQMSNLASGEFSGVSFIPGQLGDNVGFTFLEGIVNPTELTVALDLLTSIDKAQVLSRPYLATRSNQPAQVQVVTQRFVAIDETSDGTTVTATDAIDAGVTLDVTPTVLADSTIRLDMSVESSRFDAAVAGTVVQKEKSSAKSSISVNSGQTIVVGGLNRQRSSASNAGLPWLRRVPFLNPLFSNQNAAEVTTEVVVYLTPYIWTPTTGLPIPQPGVPRLHSSNFSHLEGVPGDEVSRY
jgi:type II secretory pathway component GspD/PulD (secretin)